MANSDLKTRLADAAAACNAFVATAGALSFAACDQPDQHARLSDLPTIFADVTAAADRAASALANLIDPKPLDADEPIDVE